MPDTHEVTVEAGRGIIRHHSMVAWSEVEPLFKRAVEVSGLSPTKFCEEIGYKAGAHAGWAKSCPRRVKLILIGYLAERDVPPTRSGFTADELGVLLDVLIGRSPPVALASLIARVSTELATLISTAKRS